MQRDYTLAMRQFIKFTLATIVGFTICTAAALMLGGIIIAGIIASGSDNTLELKDKSILQVNLSGSITEYVEENPFNEIMGYASEQQGLDDIIGAIDKAANTKEITSIYVAAGITSTDYATLQEIRNALLRAKAKGKMIISYAKEYTQGAYYVCSVADKVWINPEGMLDLHGIASRPMYIKDLMEKFGVRMKVVKVGKYKSATEQYTEDRMSDENRLQVTRYAGNIWNVIANGISKARGISIEDVNRCADELTMLKPAAYLLNNRLVDKTLYAEDVESEIKKLIKVDEGEDLEKISCNALNTSDIGLQSSSDKIAVYHCEGSIVRSAEAGVITGDAGIVSHKMVKDLEKLRKDKNVKAVVVRINSGGGDAFASEEIWHAMKTLREKKPVVVSMGGAAASGAYYMACTATHIIAQSTTLTGSIGIFGAFPDISGLMTEKLGVKYDNVKTNRHSDFSFLQTARPFNEDEERMLQEYINRGYDLFCKRVSDGRKIPLEKVRQIAEGRVWSGDDALKIGLVDAIGGIDTAMKKAAQLANVKKYETLHYPIAPNWLEQLTEAANGGSSADSQLRDVLGVMYTPFMTIRNMEKQSPVQAMCPITVIRE